MPHGYCTECSATVTVRDGVCLLGHPVSAATLTRGRGRHASSPAARRRASSRPATVAPPRPAPRSVPPPPVPPADPPAGRQAPPRPRVPVTASRTVAELDPTSLSIARLWEQADTGALPTDWAPTPIDEHRLEASRRRWRLPVVLAVVAVLAGTWWAWEVHRQHQTIAQTAVVRADATDLGTALVTLGGATADLQAASSPDGRTAAGTALAATEAAARSLFDAAAALPAGDGVLAGHQDPLLRMEATEIAGDTLDLTSTVGDVVAYTAAFGEFAVSPPLPTQVSEEDLPTTAADVSAWVTRFQTAAAALPSPTILGDHPQRVRALAQSLDAFQADYLGGLRRNDPAAAAAAADRLEANLAALGSSLDVYLADAESSETTTLADLQGRLGSLTANG